MILPDIRQLMSCCTPAFRCQAVSPGPDWALQYEPRGRSPNWGKIAQSRRTLPVLADYLLCSGPKTFPVPRLKLWRVAAEAMPRAHGADISLAAEALAAFPRPSCGEAPPSSLRATRSAAASRRMIQNAAELRLRPGASPSANSGELSRCAFGAARGARGCNETLANFKIEPLLADPKILRLGELDGVPGAGGFIGLADARVP